MIACALATRLAHADRERALSFAQAVDAALAHNSDLAVARVDTALADDEVALASSVFAPRLIASAKLARDDQPGDAVNFAWTDTTARGSLALTGRIRSGLTYTLSADSLLDRFSSPFQTIYRPAYTTSLGLTLTQPLLRGGWRAANMQPIVVASLRAQLSQQQLRARLEQLVGDIAVAYWSLALSYKEREARASSLQLAKDQAAESARLIKLGNISELDVVEAQAGVGRAQQALLAVDQQLLDAEARLRALVIGGPDWQPDETLRPADAPATDAVSPTLAEHLAIARRNRPDLAVAAGTLAVERAGLAVTADDRKPQLDLVLSATAIGFAGELQNTYATAGVADGTLTPAYAPDRDLEGGAARALGNLATAGNYAVSLGLRLELPLDHSAADARHARQRHAVTRAELAQRAVQVQIENDVRRSLGLVTSDARLARAAEDAVAVHQRLLAGMRKRFSAGTVTSFDVLRVSDALTQAEIDVARARTNYRISLARLAISEGTLLQQLNISVAGSRDAAATDPARAPRAPRAPTAPR